MKKTAIDYLIDLMNMQGFLGVYCTEDKIDENRKLMAKIIEQAKQMEKEQMIKFAEFVATYRDKNKNYKSEMLHAKSKYDQAERTIDLLEEYYNETYGGNK